MMRRKLLTSTLLLGFTAVVIPTALAAKTVNNAQSSTGVVIPSAKTTQEIVAGTIAQHLANLQTRGDAQIQLRLTTLNKLVGVIAAAKHMSSADKASLTDEVKTETTGLTSLQTKLKAETTVASAQADVQSIFTEFRVYALIDPKVHLVKAADDQQTIEATLSSLASKLQDRITKDKAAGKDVASMQTTLDSMKKELASTQAMSSDIETKVIALQPTDYNSDHTILKQYDDELKTAHADCHVAHQDAKTVINDLQAVKN